MLEVTGFTGVGLPEVVLLATLLLLAVASLITVVQQPGPNNALGFMKLDMPNEHAIFIHDTPSRGLFNQTFRALSHGCVRVEDPVALAEYLLRGDWPENP